ncbi:hypothetical protein ACFWN2_12625 [Lentzea sp. NPDC058436]|uniref:hypothetical protein n=1 Tax=Lentzea sp. NPDC058436 TaxID=3346499 RepID=UPI00364EF787
MPPDRPHSSLPAQGFTQARLDAEQAAAVQQRQAAHRVAEHSRDAGDCLDLLQMLGLTGLAPRTPEAPGVFRSTEGALR